jgi:hypothetical protein
MDDLTDFLNNLVKETKVQMYEKAKAKAVPPAKVERDIRFARLSSSRWKDEAIVLLVTESRCACGANFEHPHPNLFVRRFHPVWGVHFEALGIKPIATTMPYKVERHISRIPHCHRCLTASDVKAIQAQMVLPLSNNVLQFTGAQA